MTRDEIQQAIDAGATAPRVTPADLEAEIVHESYFTAADGAYQAGRGADYSETEWAAILGPLRLLTFCVLTLRNGFTVTGESACVSAENFDAEIGRKIARKNAVEKLWPLMGFRLADKLAEAAADDGYPRAEMAVTST